MRSLRGLVLGIALSALLGCSSKSDGELVASARANLNKGNTTAALIELKSALQQNPRLAEARYLMGGVFLQQGDPVSAAVSLSQARNDGYPDDKVLPLLARATLRSGKVKDVVQLYGDVTLKDAHADASLKSVLATAYSWQGDFGRAETFARKALELDGKSVDARIALARLLAAKGDPDGAMRLVTDATVNEPRSVEAWHLLGDLHWIAKGDAPAATVAYEKALSVEPRYVEAHSALIMMALSNNDVVGFKARVAALKKVRPNALETRFHEAEVALLDRNLEQARGIIQQLLKAVPDHSRVLQLAGAIELQAGELSAARSHLQKALTLNPELQFARHLLAETHLRSGDSEKALAVLEPLFRSQRVGTQTLGLAGEARLQLGDLAGAELLLAQAAEKKPSDDKLGTAHALAMIARGATNEGFAKLTALADGSKETTADLALVSSYTRRGELDAALKAAESLRVKMPNKALPHLLAGRIALQKRDWAGARARFEKALSIEPTFLPANIALAELDLVEKKPADATKRLEALLAKDPKNTGALVALALHKKRIAAPAAEITQHLTDAVHYGFSEKTPRVLLVSHYLTLSQTKDALEVAREAAAQFPADPQILEALGRAQMASGDLQQALATFGKQAAAQPGSAAPYLRLAEVETKNGRPATAGEHIERALQIAPDLPAAQNALVQWATRNKRQDEALRIARGLQKKLPKSAVGFTLEATFLSMQRKWEPTIAALERALTLSDTVDVAVRLHSAYTLAGKKAEAKELAKRWMQSHPRDGAFLLQMATFWMAERDFSQAEGALRQALALTPDQPRALNNLAWVLLEQRKPGARELAAKANELVPDNPAFMDTLATALLAEGRPGPALELQRKAVERVPDNYGLRLNLAKAMIAAGERGAARTELQRLSKLGVAFQGQAEVSKLLQSL